MAKNEKSIANFEKVKFDKLTDDGKKHKQGEKVRIKVFGVTVETNY